ncbi:MAG: hypothetical protein IPG64_13735 [Haliea sp.]|nr:hypothetical protein [Haliea sp.]
MADQRYPHRVVARRGRRLEQIVQDINPRAVVTTGTAQGNRRFVRYTH